ncbi:MAG: hypothetical protein ACRDK7_10180, partial [Solirubrobacteraceae bacterium]
MSALKISTRNAEGAPGKRVRRAALAVFALLAAVAPGSAAALSQGAQWTVTTHSAPTNLKHGGAPQQVVVDVQDTGGAPAEGATQPIAVTAALPPGLTTSAAATATDLRSGQPMSCTTLTMAVTCTYSHVVSVDDFVELAIPVEVQAGAAEGTASGSVSVSGGGAPAGQAPLTLDSTPAGFAFAPGSTA